MNISTSISNWFSQGTSSRPVSKDRSLSFPDETLMVLGALTRGDRTGAELGVVGRDPAEVSLDSC